MIKLFCIQTYHAHWAGHSGYHHFLEHLPDDIQVTHMRIPRETVDREKLRGTEKIWFKSVARWSKGRLNPWTTENDLLAEFRLLAQVKESMKLGEKVNVHFLDGEIGYNFFGTLRRLLGRDAKRVRLMATFHQPGPILEKVLPYKERVKNLDLVLTVGSSQNPFFNYLPVERLRFVPHGIDTAYFRPDEHAVGNKRIHCLTVGHWLRDFDVLEKVIQNSSDDTIFQIVAAKEHVKRFQSLKNVQLYSDIDDDELLNLYQNADIGLMPLQDSTANNGILEMLGCGLPVISTRVGSVADYVTNGVGLLLERNEPDMILTAIKRFRDSPEERSSYGKAARLRALELDWANIAHELEDLYRRI